jgi:hypothetical protein
MCLQMKRIVISEFAELGGRLCEDYPETQDRSALTLISGLCSATACSTTSVHRLGLENGDSLRKLCISWR